MKKLIQPTKESCLITAVACVAHPTIPALYEAVNIPCYACVHYEQVVRALMGMGYRPVTMERSPEWAPGEPASVSDFFEHFKVGVLIGPGREDLHAYAYEHGEVWNPNGRMELTLPEFYFGLELSRE